VRARQIRNFFATLLLSQGVPMISMGDELGKTQRGNNNPYCLDDETSWIDWDLGEASESLLGWVQDLVRLRRHEPVFRRKRFLRGEKVAGSKSKDIGWFRPDGEEMTLTDWQRPARAAIGLLLAGDALGWTDAAGRDVVGDTFFLMLSAAPEPVTFAIPSAAWGDRWDLVFDTRGDSFELSSRVSIFEPKDKMPLVARSVAVLRRTSPIRGSWKPFRTGA
jgi:glycogen operon protein